ncbi:MAG TPA: aromatic acid decarboxylase [Candidatus Latescibacteria bacterium]|nr:aromatic acid decarboxylase [Candidatus Latescibacterota bacterium]
MSDTKSFIVAVTGASGAIYATRTMRAMLAAGNHVHLVLSKYGRYVMHEELGWEPDNESILDFLARTTGDEIRAGTLEEHGVNDLTRAISSGSSPVSGMVVVPCSAKSLAAIAHGTSSNLIERSADVTLKERRPLVLVIRETPMNLIQLRNMVTVAEAGAAVLPAMPAFYQKPKSFDDLGDFIAGRALSLLGVDHELFEPWTGPQ